MQAGTRRSISSPGHFSSTIAEHGPDSVAFYISGQLLTEDYYVANKLMKGFIGAANIDTNSRLCMASSVAGHRRAFGADTVPGTYEDLELADLIVLVGSNLAWCHPVLYQRIAAAMQKRPQMKIVLVDPRRTMTADIAEMHLAVRPDGDVALFNGLLAWLADHDALDRAYIAGHTSGFDDAFAAASAMSFDEIAEQTGVAADELRAFYALFARTEKVVTVYSQGVNQSSAGTDKVNAIINCHFATGRIGRAGMGPFSVTGQPNAMGGREVGGLANMLAAHMEIENAEHRDCLQRFWRAPTMAERPGLKAVEMFRAVADGRIKAIWIMGTNPVVSMPDADFVEAALKACPLVVVSDVVAETDTLPCAHIKLPAAAWGEKDGPLPIPSGGFRDSGVFCRCPALRGRTGTSSATSPNVWALPMPFLSSPQQRFSPNMPRSRPFENDGARDFDIGAFADIDAVQFDNMVPFQWPRPTKSAPSETRFFADGNFYTADRKGRFIAVTPCVETRTNSKFPFVLTPDVCVTIGIR